MTEDKEWSLKEKEMEHMLEHNQMVIKVYSKSQVEILRQKLIDDFRRVYNNSSMITLPYNFSLENIEKLINKRFGVED